MKEYKAKLRVNQDLTYEIIEAINASEARAILFKNYYKRSFDKSITVNLLSLEEITNEHTDNHIFFINTISAKESEVEMVKINATIEDNRFDDDYLPTGKSPLECYVNKITTESFTVNFDNQCVSVMGNLMTMVENHFRMSWDQIQQMIITHYLDNNVLPIMKTS